MSYFIDTATNIVANNKLRNPQIEAYIKIQEYFKNHPNGEALVVLPTGTGKSGVVSIAPFGVSQGRVLIVTPGLVTKQSIQKTQEILCDNFWINYDVIFDIDDLPIVSEFTSEVSQEHLESSNFIYSNVQKLGSHRKHGLLNRVEPDFFDMVIIDEAHHAPAESWREILGYFKNAKKLHLTGTPYRGDNQEIPGEKIHETPLSEVMRDRYVKWLRKETVNSHELYFTVSDRPGEKLSKDAVLEIKEQEWVERSVALSEHCSKDVIQHSIKKLRELKEVSSEVPHKILAVGCSISHAEDLYRWYEEHEIESVILHSGMSDEEKAKSFQKIDNHRCEAVISVNMLMEGYDHQYLSVLAIFRPYRSINAFAQIVGRVLRAIPEEQITAFEIDNNAIVIYHEETGLNTMWDVFQKEVDRAKHQRVRNYTFSEQEYVEREKSLAGVISDNAFISDQESYLDDIDFNQLFSKAREDIHQAATEKIKALEGLDGFDDAHLEAIKAQFTKIETNKATKEHIDPLLTEKRPAQARKKMRELLKKKVEDEIANLLSDLNLEDKGVELASKFKGVIYHLKPETPNDGTLVRYVNVKLQKKFGSIKERDNQQLLQSIDEVANIVDELRGMLGHENK